MKVELFDYTGCGTPDPAKYAACKLIFTKRTRLEQDEGLRIAIDFMSMDSINHELDYIARTVPGSWEFITYDFSIQGVTRAFTHQLVRTRNASYAQQSMRVTDQGGFDYLAGPSIIDGSIYHAEMLDIKFAYKKALEEGATIEDARGLLPTNILTNICMHANLRTITQMAKVRSSPRVQGEYREFIGKMVEAVEFVHPWTWKFFRETKEIVNELEGHLEEAVEDKQMRTEIWKLIDELKNG